MPLSASDRKERIPHGAQREIAAELHLAESYVSAVMTGDARPKTARARATVRRVQVAIAQRLELPVEEAFPQTTQEAALTAAQAS